MLGLKLCLRPKKTQLGPFFQHFSYILPCDLKMVSLIDKYISIAVISELSCSLALWQYLKSSIKWICANKVFK